MNIDLFRRAWFLTGPTAGGKTAVGVALARRLNAEILSMDSMALYRGMDIGTAKPTVEERGGVPHQLIDVIEPGAEFSLSQFVDRAHRTAEEIAARGNTPLFVGGTPLYLKGLLRGVFHGPPADWELRRGLQAEAAERGADALHARLATVDPAAAARLHPRDARRIIRAIEVFEKSGRPISEWQQQFNTPVPREECRVFVLSWPRDVLHSRIDRRVEAMFAAGLVEEVRRLRAAGPLSRTASQALGYREVLEHLDGARSIDETIELVKMRTRQFAKRQLTWFRSLSECRLVQMHEGFDARETAKKIVESVQTPGK